LKLYLIEGVTPMIVGVIPFSGINLKIQVEENGFAFIHE
jgi:hypothetical protein